METKKHSGLGIVSFITSIALGVLVSLLIIVDWWIRPAFMMGGESEEFEFTIWFALLLLPFLVLMLVSLGIGLGGIFQKDRKKLFAILGVVFSAAMMMGTIVIMILELTIWKIPPRFLL